MFDIATINTRPVSLSLSPYKINACYCVTVMDSRAEVSSNGSGKKNGMKNEGAKKQMTVRSQFTEEGEGSDINKQAEDFIKNFRNELKIQRVESLKHFKEMLDRGT